MCCSTQTVSKILVVLLLEADTILPGRGDVGAELVIGQNTCMQDRAFAAPLPRSLTCSPARPKVFRPGVGDRAGPVNCSLSTRAIAFRLMIE